MDGESPVHNSLLVHLVDAGVGRFVGSTGLLDGLAVVLRRQLDDTVGSASCAGLQRAHRRGGVGRRRLGRSHAHLGRGGLEPTGLLGGVLVAQLLVGRDRRGRVHVGLQGVADVRVCLLQHLPLVRRQVFHHRFARGHGALQRHRVAGLDSGGDFAGELQGERVRLADADGVQDVAR